MSADDQEPPKDEEPINPWAKNKKPSQKPHSAERFPWENQRGRQSENNVDDFLKKAGEEIRRKFSSSDGSSGLPSFQWIWLIAFVLISGWLSTGIFRVQEGEAGVILRFGRLDRVTGAGLQYHMPMPFEQVIVQNITSVNSMSGGLKTDAAKNSQSLDMSDQNLVLTGDENMVHISYIIQWRIKDVAEYLFTARDPDNTIKAASESVIREVIGQISAKSALTEKREAIASKVQEILQALLDQYKLGVHLVSVQLQGILAPGPVVEAFNDLQASLIDADRLKNEAEAYKNEIIPRARGQAVQVIQLAQGYKQQTVATAEGEASRFLAILANLPEDKESAVRRMYTETMQQILSKSNKIIIDSKIAKNIMPYLPLQDALKKVLPTEQAPQKGGQ